MAKTKNTKQVILDSALSLFSEHGFKGATMRAIASKANISLGLTYSYFENKDELLKSLLLGFIQDRRLLFRKILTSKDIGQKSSIDIIKIMILDIKKNREQFRLYAQLMLSPQPSKNLSSIKKSLIEFHKEEKLFVKKINEKHGDNDMIPAELFKVIITGMMFLHLHREDFDIDETMRLIKPLAK